MKKIAILAIPFLLGVTACSGSNNKDKDYAEDMWNQLSPDSQEELCDKMQSVSEQQVIDILTSEPDAISSSKAHALYNTIKENC